jgi:hypothetical protein
MASGGSVPFAGAEVKESWQPTSGLDSQPGCALPRAVSVILQLLALQVSALFR